MTDSSAGFVRLALPSEAARIAAIQLEHFTQPEHPASRVADELNLDDLTQAWHRAIVAPPLANYRVLVATQPAADGTQEVVGMVATAPSNDSDAQPSDGEVMEFLLTAAARGKGHGSRLVNAAVDTLRADGFTRARWWLLSTDDALRGFLLDMGWGADGSTGQVEVGDQTVKMVRLHTDIRQ